MCREHYLNIEKGDKIGLLFEKNLFHCFFVYHKSPTKYPTIENGSVQGKASLRILMCELGNFFLFF
jgi:hypothetical protein